MSRRGQKPRRRLGGVRSSVCLTCCLMTPVRHHVTDHMFPLVCLSCFQSAQSFSQEREREKKEPTSADGFINIESWFSSRAAAKNRRRKKTNNKPQRLYFKACMFIISWLLSMRCCVFCLLLGKKKFNPFMRFVYFFLPISFDK